MQKTTIQSYPHLVAVRPINGIVYKTSHISPPKPKISVMSLHEVQMHQKQESVAEVMQKDKPRRKLLRMREKFKAYLQKSILCSDFEPSDTSAEEQEIPARPIPRTQQTPTRESLSDEAIAPLRRLKRAWNKAVKQKGSSSFADAECNDSEEVRQPEATSTLKPGFHCAKGGCEECSPPPPVTPLRVLPSKFQVLNIPIFPSVSESVSSEFTTTTASLSGSSDPFPSSPTDLNVFQDFDGTYIQPTPPQLTPLRPLSSFVSKLQGSVFANTDWSLVELDYVEGGTELTVPHAGVKENPYLTPSVSDDEDWSLRIIDTPVPSMSAILEQEQREWLFKENMPEETLNMLARRGDRAQERRFCRV
ncbi:hypothetical protein DE146DRAFT_773344 [Phaeosphaeria sp. MPI-PUGE-AT-0046c]|nr:hypothetical protein DE146DRAFT_773344 [Phaeosphaeria sp. MPI-PUGE-AT-0046c]